MCGISGVISNKNISPYLVSKMVLSQKHRGPDNSTTKRLEDNVIFGHNRLSIISLDESSNQPFTCKDKRYTITYNGEIYNYIELRNQLKSFWTFKTTSDTEVLLAAYSVWGHKCLDKLNGMFSFCIWDKKFKKLFMARDRFGVKPLHYYINNEKLVFASEIKALWAYGIKKTLNQKVCSAYLKYGSYGDLNNTFWKGVSQLPAGNYAIYEANKIKLFKWYNFRSRVINLENDTYKIDRIKELIIDAIKIRFRADVPIGINLSGGVDSSTLLSIVNLLFKDNNHIKPFTFFTDDYRYDEIKWVVSMLKNNSDNLEKCLLKYTNVPSLTKKLMKYQDEPFGGIPTIAYGKVFERAKNIGYKVLLDGQGADESWAGYDYYNSDSKLTIQGTKVSPFKINV
ncbi:asparagine synthase (glutamine-hydrolyzing), partial [Candidatus Marinimicrobia bacterium]|nr:asparagine synthase (glutamine-hydrolyzing) [Candidatus Neomarinimicrobiota bacterium]